MRTRKEIEELEDKILAPYAMKSKDSKGREYDNSQHDIRTCYQRDRDRIVHCEAFRKLEYKTQVFVILEGDYYRTRLTHTIEVAQIARTIGRSLGLNEDLIEAIALAHDLGHPPFGHAGEDALKAMMKEIKGNFNHNFRSYEIITRFEKRYPDFDGLDLTEEVRAGILKHETEYDHVTELEKYKKTGPTLEARVVDVADALAYISHDIDDGLTSGCITKEDLIESQLWRGAYERIASALDPNNKEMLKYQAVKYLIDVQTKDLLQNTSEKLKNSKFMNSQEAKDYHLALSKKDKKKREEDSVINFSPQMREQRKVLQKILMEKLYKHYRVVRMTEKAKRVISEIFKVYSDNPDQLPYNYYLRDREYTEKEKYQTICNYIAGMTDRYALDEHEKLFNPYQKV